jgi:hypothetical protein
VYSHTTTAATATATTTTALCSYRHQSRVQLRLSGETLMAAPSAYTYVANGLVKFFTDEIHTLPPFEQGFIPMNKVPAAAGATAKKAVDLYEEYLAKLHQET